MEKITKREYENWMALPAPPSPNKVDDSELPALIDQYSVLLYYSTAKQRDNVLSWTPSEQYKSLRTKYYNEKRKLKEAGYNVDFPKAKVVPVPVTTPEIEQVTLKDGDSHINWICTHGSHFDLSNLSIDVLGELMMVLPKMLDDTKVFLEIKLDEEVKDVAKKLEVNSIEKHNLEEKMSNLMKQCDKLKMSA